MSDAKEFWNARAEENAFHFVDNRIDYLSPDEERFWADGERDLATLLELVGVQLTGTEDVVEIGCGVGRLTRPLAAGGRTVRALDVSSTMLRLAAEHNPALTNVEWIEGDGTSLAPIEAGSADACVSHVVFQHIPDPRITLGYVAEIGRVLRPGGWAVFQISNDPSVHERRPGGRDRLKAVLGRRPKGQAHPNWRGSHVEIEDLRDTAARAGMEIERLVGEGTQYCVVRMMRQAATDRSA
jgi:SAM-dependent methyltransferase